MWPTDEVGKNVKHYFEFSLLSRHSSHDKRFEDRFRKKMNELLVIWLEHFMKFIVANSTFSISHKLKPELSFTALSIIPLSFQ